MNGAVEDRSRRVFGMSETALDFLIPFVLSVIFVALIALLLWPLGKAMLAFRLAKGFGIFWLVTVVTAFALYRIQRLFHVDTDTHVNAYVISNASLSVFLLAGWSAFAVMTAHSFVGGIPMWQATVIWLTGLLSSVVAFVVLTSIYRGAVYRLINIALSLVSFVIFAIWPASGRALYGWFFDLF